MDKMDRKIFKQKGFKLKSFIRKMDIRTEEALQEIENISVDTNELKAYLLDIAKSLRILSKRPDLDKEPIDLEV